MFKKIHVVIDLILKWVCCCNIIIIQQKDDWKPIHLINETQVKEPILKINPRYLRYRLGEED